MRVLFSKSLPKSVERTFDVKGEKITIKAPETWSDNACMILYTKYMRKAGVPDFVVRVKEKSVPDWLCRKVAGKNPTYGPEITADQVFGRLAGAWTYQGFKNKYFNAKEAEIYYKEMYAILANQIGAPNSPQWFNTGLWWAYGIEGEKSGGYYIDPKTNEAIESPDSYTHPQASACYINHIEDDLLSDDGIMSLWVKEARLFKYGSGSGANYSKVRGLNEPLSHGGKSSGLMSFLKVGDSSAGAIKSGGTTRRAARLVVTDDDHPDIEDFIDWKMNEETKVAMLDAGSQTMQKWLGLITQNNGPDIKWMEDYIDWGHDMGVPDGFINRVINALECGVPLPTVAKMDSTDWQSEAYQTVSGQNANNSVSVSHTFMNAVDDDTYWNLNYRTGGVKKNIKAKDLWNKISYAAWSCADPGLFFRDTINEWHTCPNEGPIRSANPCLVGETLVDTSEGKIRIDDLYNMYRKGKKLPMVFSFSRKKRMPVLRKINKVMLTKETNDLVRVKTDKGIEVVCTPDHRFLTRIGKVPAGEYVEAKDLRVGTRLRKIGRLCNDQRSDRCSISTRKGDFYQNRFIWEEINGEIPEGYEVHHKDEISSNDKYSNLELVEAKEHRLFHSIGTNNSNSIEISDQRLVETFEDFEVWIEHNSKGTKEPTISRWNRFIEDNNLKGVVPLANPQRGLRGMEWNKFVSWVDDNRGLVNHRIVSVERFQSKTPVKVYDLEIPDTHNFGVTNSYDNDADSIIVHNCIEYMFIDDTSCNLASQNLKKFLNAGGKFDIDSFVHATELWTYTLDITVGMAQYPAKRIAEQTAQTRTLGLGYANVGGLLMSMGIPYDSSEGRYLVAGITSLMHSVTLHVSSKLGTKLGSFPAYKRNEKEMDRVVWNHWKACCAYLDESTEYADLTIKPYIERANISNKDKYYLLFDNARAYYSGALGKGNYRNAQTVVIAPTGCLVAGSLVSTSLGLVRIENLGNKKGSKWQDVEFMVATDEGPKKATKYFLNGKKPVLKIVTERGYEITGTHKHQIKIAAEDGQWHWTRFDNLQKGKIVPIALNTFVGKPNEIRMPVITSEYKTNKGRAIKVPSYMGIDLATFIGLFMAEGSVHQKGLRLCLTTADQDLIDEALELSINLFNIEVGIEEDGECTNLYLNSMQLLRWWEESGLIKRKHKKSSNGYNCFIPDCILRSNNPKIYAAFLRGLYAGDGSTASGLPNITNKSKKFIGEVRSMLAMLGIVVRTDSFIGGLSNKPVYRITVTSRRHSKIWNDLIGFIPKRKADKVIIESATVREDYIPIDFELADNLCPIGHKFRSKLMENYNKYGAMSRGLALDLYEEAKDKELEYAMSFFYDRIEEIVDCGIKETYDLSVPENVTYIANGFISHNTIGLVMDCDTTGIEPDYSLVKFKTLAGGGSMNIVNQSVRSALEKLGYLETSINEIEDYILKNKTIEGCNVLDPNQLSIFDCATPGGNGIRSISPQGHLLMMAVAQPFVSGAISKTVNLPNNATLEDVSWTYKSSYHLGIKAIALYRDGAKLSQPLMSAPVKKEKPTFIPQPMTIDQLQKVAEVREKYKEAVFEAKKESPGVFVNEVTIDTVSNLATRQKLPNERRGTTVKAEVGGHKIYLRTGEYEDGRLGEIFLDMAKEGDTLRAIANNYAIAVSIGLQHGVPLDEYVDAFTFTKFEPAGLVKGHKRFKRADSILDFVFRDLAIRYLGRNELAHVSGEEKVAETPKVNMTVNFNEIEKWGKQIKTSFDENTSVIARSYGFTGDRCTDCGKFTMIRNGTCLKCESCGSTTGCS